MPLETPRQIDLFTGQAVDTRTRQQKQRDKQRSNPQQQTMFSTREVAQFGVKARPMLSLSPHSTLMLMAEDPRTDEEKERDLQRQAQKLTYDLFQNNQATQPLTKPPLHQDPARYLEHLHQTPQLSAPPEVFLLANWAVSIEPRRHPMASTFGEWLESELGKEVLHRIMNNRHSVTMTTSMSYFDTMDDVQQKALIYLFERWERDPNFTRLTHHTTSFSHDAGYITFIAMRASRCKYAKRRIQKSEQQVPLNFDEGDEMNYASTMLPVSIRATDMEANDRSVWRKDMKVDVEAAIERVVLRMVDDYAIVPKNYRRVPIEHITRTILEGHKFHYDTRYSGKGGFRHFCERRNVNRNAINKWRPRIFEYLRQELEDYQPAEMGTAPKVKQAAAD